jgi:hypothetical protein
LVVDVDARNNGERGVSTSVFVFMRCPDPDLELKQRVAMDNREAWRVSISNHARLLTKTGYLEELGKETAAELVHKE